MCPYQDCPWTHERKADAKRLEIILKNRHKDTAQVNILHHGTLRKLCQRPTSDSTRFCPKCALKVPPIRKPRDRAMQLHLKKRNITLNLVANIKYLESKITEEAKDTLQAEIGKRFNLQKFYEIYN